MRRTRYASSDPIQRIRRAMMTRYAATLETPTRVRLSPATRVEVSEQLHVLHRSREANQHPMAPVPLLMFIAGPGMSAAIPVEGDGGCAPGVALVDYPQDKVIEVDISDTLMGEESRDEPRDWRDEYERLRRWRQPIYYRLFFAIGCVLAAFNWLTLLSALWLSNINRSAAAALTLWFVLAQVFVFWWFWRWLGPLMRSEREVKHERQTS